MVYSHILQQGCVTSRWTGPGAWDNPFGYLCPLQTRGYFSWSVLVWWPEHVPSWSKPTGLPYETLVQLDAVVPLELGHRCVGELSECVSCLSVALRSLLGILSGEDAGSHQLRLSSSTAWAQAFPRGPHPHHCPPATHRWHCSSPLMDWDLVFQGTCRLWAGGPLHFFVT